MLGRATHALGKGARLAGTIGCKLLLRVYPPPTGRIHLMICLLGATNSFLLLCSRHGCWHISGQHAEYQDIAQLAQSVDAGGYLGTAITQAMGGQTR